jgi:hypothetical protein
MGAAHGADPLVWSRRLRVPSVQPVARHRLRALVAGGAGEDVTVGEAAETYAFRFSMPQVIGTPSKVADQLEVFRRADGAGAAAPWPLPHALPRKGVAGQHPRGLGRVRLWWVGV